MKRRTRAVLAALFALSVLCLPACGSEQGGDERVGPPVLAAAKAEPQEGLTEEVAAIPEEQASPEGEEPNPKDEPKARKKAAPTPVETVRLAAKKTNGAKTAKFTVFMEFSGIRPEGEEGPDGFSMRVDGAADFDKKVSKFTMYMPYIGQMKVRQIGPDVYQKMPEWMRSQLPYEEAWIRWSNDDAAGGSENQSSEARTSTPDEVTSELQYLRGVSDSVEETGRDWVRGVATTHYEAEIDLDRAAEQGSPKLRELFRQAKEELGAETLPVETWLDDDGRVRRFKMDVPLESAELSDAGVDGARVTLTEEIYDYGAPVTVKAPPEDDTVDMEEMAERARERSS